MYGFGWMEPTQVNLNLIVLRNENLYSYVLRKFCNCITIWGTCKNILQVEHMS